MRNDERHYRSNESCIEYVTSYSSSLDKILRAKLWEKFEKSKSEPEVFAEKHRGQISSNEVMGW